MKNDRPGALTFKDVILEVAEQRNDEVASRVKHNLRTVIDLPAGDAQYHKHCYSALMKMTKHHVLSVDSVDEAMRGVIDRMYDDRSRLWNVLELHALYSELGGKLCRKRMLSNLADCLGDNTVLVRLDGCASILGFREFVGKAFKLVKLDEKDDDTIDGLVKQIHSESQAMAIDIDIYDLSDFIPSKAIQATSPILLKLISELTHWGRVTHICVGNLTTIGPDNGLSPGRRQAITWINVGILLIGPLGTNFSEMLIEIHTFSFKKIHLKMSSGKWRPFWLGLNMLMSKGEVNKKSLSLSHATQVQVHGTKQH